MTRNSSFSESPAPGFKANKKFTFGKNHKNFNFAIEFVFDIEFYFPSNLHALPPHSQPNCRALVCNKQTWSRSRRKPKPQSFAFFPNSSVSNCPIIDDKCCVLLRSRSNQDFHCKSLQFPFFFIFSHCVCSFELRPAPQKLFHTRRTGAPSSLRASSHELSGLMSS